MPNAVNYTDEEILLALIWVTPSRLTKGQIGRLLGVKSAGQKHWSVRLERLWKKKLLSIERLNVGELFHGSPILKYYITPANLEAIWSYYFTHYDDRHGLVNDPFLTPFSAGIWNVNSSPEFSKLVGSKFNFHFLCAKNEANPVALSDRIKSLSKEKIWKIMDAVLSIGWKTEAYRRKPALMETLTPVQRKAYDLVSLAYGQQIDAHPADYKNFCELFEKNFKYYL
ncbi:hypothetical protein AUJ65_01195 [Candidatus Micrarchaeota archaeon CG1_02_51_15]|nr:MAG: hypothetical protein AUJ65_01195 [Candidatus Micrarchaeota archaeon CG1_02_51_15]